MAWRSKVGDMIWRFSHRIFHIMNILKSCLVVFQWPAEISLKFPERFLETIWRCPRLVSGCVHGVSCTCPGNLWEHSWTFPECFPNISQTYPRFFPDMSKIFYRPSLRLWRPPWPLFYFSVCVRSLKRHHILFSRALSNILSLKHV